MGVRSLGTTPVMELSWEPAISQLPITSQSAMPRSSSIRDFSSTVRGTSVSSRAAQDPPEAVLRMMVEEPPLPGLDRRKGAENQYPRPAVIKRRDGMGDGLKRLHGITCQIFSSLYPGGSSSVNALPPRRPAKAKSPRYTPRGHKHAVPAAGGRYQPVHHRRCCGHGSQPRPNLPPRDARAGLLPEPPDAQIKVDERGK